MNKENFAEWHIEALHDELFNIKEEIIALDIDNPQEILRQVEYAQSIQNEIENRE